MSNHRIASPLPLCALLVTGLSHAATIRYQVTDVDYGAGAEAVESISRLQRYTYYADGISFLMNQEVDIVFSAELYGMISHGVISQAFDLMLFQPNNPPGAPGHFSALARSDIAPDEGPWSVDFLFIGPGQPGPQTFFINQFDEKSNFIRTLESGITSGDQGVPEPGTFVQLGLVIVGCAVWWAARRRSVRTAHRSSRTS